VKDNTTSKWRRKFTFLFKGISIRRFTFGRKSQLLRRETSEDFGNIRNKKAVSIQD
jgi:hypothetical protein